jgi:hypothetical protein
MSRLSSLSRRRLRLGLALFHKEPAEQHRLGAVHVDLLHQLV